MPTQFNVCGIHRHDHHQKHGKADKETAHAVLRAMCEQHVVTKAWRRVEHEGRLNSCSVRAFAHGGYHE